MFNWLKRKKWLVVNAVLVATLLSLLGLQVADRRGGLEDRGAIKLLGIGGEKVITLGHIVYAAGSVDYTYDGVDDDVQFQAALNALPATGGKLVDVSAVQKNFSATVTRAIPNVTITGSGAGSYFTNDGGTTLFTAGGNNWHFSDLRVDTGGIDMGVTTGGLWTNVTIATQLYTYYAPTAGTGSIYNLEFGNSTISSLVTGGYSDGIQIVNPDYDDNIIRILWYPSGSATISTVASGTGGTGSIVLESRGADVVLGAAGAAGSPETGMVEIRRQSDSDAGNPLISSHNLVLQGARWDGTNNYIRLGVQFVPDDVNNDTGYWHYADGISAVYGNGAYIASDSTNADTLEFKANDTTFITLTTGPTDSLIAENITMKGTWLGSGTPNLPNFTMGSSSISAVGGFSFSSIAATLSAGGVMTKSKGVHIVDTFGGAATDNLSSITGAVGGDFIVLQSTSDARDITIDETGNIQLAGGSFVLDNVLDRIALLYNTGTATWVELFRSDNGS